MTIDHNKYLFLIVGIPGSGKSTFARILKTASVFSEIGDIEKICEADDFFTNYGKSEYKFNPKLLCKAHEQCQLHAAEVMDRGNNLIVSNTGLSPRDRKPYFKMAGDFGYKVVYIHLTTDFGSIHNVPTHAIERMKKSYVKPTADELPLIVKKNKMTPELKMLLDDVGFLGKYEF